MQSFGTHEPDLARQERIAAGIIDVLNTEMRAAQRDGVPPQSAIEDTMRALSSACAMAITSQWNDLGQCMVMASQFSGVINTTIIATFSPPAEGETRN